MDMTIEALEAMTYDQLTHANAQAEFLRAFALSYVNQHDNSERLLAS